jgi:asparagine synthetase B (glutamine-hydrolysing)
METRFPLLDEHLTDYLMTLPPSYLLSGKGDTSQTYEKGKVKKLLYDAFKKELPADFITRNKKGFEMPFHSWLSEAISGIVKEELNNLHPVFKNKEFLMSLLEEEMKQGGWIKNWSIFVLNFWLRKNFKKQSNN